MKFIGFSLLFFLISLVSKNADAREATHKMLLLSEHLPPYQIIENGRLIAGTNYEKVQRLLTAAGINAEFKATPWARSYNIALTTANVLLFSLARTEDREAKFHWLMPLSSHKTILISQKGKHHNISNLEQLKSYVVAVKRDDVVHNYLLQRGFIEGRNLFVVLDTDPDYSAALG